MFLLGEILMVIAGVGIMAKAADMENRSGGLWGGLTLGLCILGFLLLPYPLLRIFLAVVLAVVIMVVVKMMESRRAN